MADLPAALRLRRELIEKVAPVLEARLQRQALTLQTPAAPAAQPAPDVYFAVTGCSA